MEKSGAAVPCVDLVHGWIHCSPDRSMYDCLNRMSDNFYPSTSIIDDINVLTYTSLTEEVSNPVKDSG
jgi:hypothetical protein